MVSVLGQCMCVLASCVLEHLTRSHTQRSFMQGRRTRKDCQRARVSWFSGVIRSTHTHTHTHTFTHTHTHSHTHTGVTPSGKTPGRLREMRVRRVPAVLTYARVQRLPRVSQTKARGGYCLVSANFLLHKRESTKRPSRYNASMCLIVHVCGCACYAVHACETLCNRCA